jgi:uncharacterized protein YbbC (DUF1343 family)
MTRSLRIAIGIFALLWSAPCLSQPVRMGDDVLLSSQPGLLRGKRIGLVINQASRLGSGEFVLDALLAGGANVSALFAPEHGIRGTAEAGAELSDTVDARTGIRIFSLYGKNRRPTPEMLKDVEVLVYDLQDVGVRFYTYLSTLSLCMAAAAEAGIPVIVLDRPNPLGGLLVDGPILPDSLRSFVGCFPIPVVYGLTIGELAAMANGEGWLPGGVRANLTVVPMTGWKRWMRWDDTGLPWIPPSPNLRTPEAVCIYPATCLLEATNISEGRGTDAPFQTIGAPFVDGDSLAHWIDALAWEGVKAQGMRFVPAASKHAGILCGGVFLSTTSGILRRPVELGVDLLTVLRAHWPAATKINVREFDRLLGDPRVAESVAAGVAVAETGPGWAAERKNYEMLAQGYFRYGEK